MTVSSPFLKILQERGFIHQVTEAEKLDEILKQGSIPAYIGFDCTAPSLHVGSLVQIMCLRWLEKSGHKPVILMGGGTTQIGDPSGKDEARQLLTKTDIAANMEGIKRVFSRFVSSSAVMVDNAQWLENLNYIDFLRDYGRHFSINRMLGFDSVKLRLEREQNLSFLEFNYMLLQAYDFVELYKRFGCRLQIGGSDQWGNIVSGIDLARRLGLPDLFGFTTPLITTSSGAKMGKTASGAIWLSRDKLSPYDYWQFWRNTEDKDVGKFLKLFTELPLNEIARLQKLEGAEINEAKKILATEATSLCHGKEEADKAASTAHKAFEEGAIDQNLPTFAVDKELLGNGIKAYELFHISGLAESSSAARRLIRGGGAKINDLKIEDENNLITNKDIKDQGVIKLTAGKKHHMLVKIQ